MQRGRFLALGALPMALCAVPFRAVGQTLTAAVLDEELPWASVPGASAAIVTTDSISLLSAGVVLAGDNRPVNDRTVFEAASLSKPVFAFAVLDRLVATGQLDLDRPLDSYLREPYPSSDARVRAITARHVLTHSSGLPNWRHAAAEALTVAFAPGTQYRYSGEGFYFLQTVVETITGLGLAAFMRPTLDALEMFSSDYIWRPAYAAVGAHPHDIHGAPLAWDSMVLGTQLQELAERDHAPLESWTTQRALDALGRIVPPRDAVPWNAMPNAAWSLYTTAADCAAFVRALLRRPDHPMLHPAMPTSRYVWRGLGIAVQVLNGARLCYHTGANPGFKAAMFADLERGRAVVSFANGDGGFPLNMHVVESALGQQPAIFDLEQP